MAIILTIGLLVFDILPSNKIPYLLVVNISDNNIFDKIVDTLIVNSVKYKVKSRNVTKDNIDVVFELSCKSTELLVDDLNKIKGITSYNLISQDGECQF